MSESGIDITMAQRKLILDLLGKYLPNTSAWAYGSRVTWKARPQSDLDMVVFAAPEQAHAVANLKEAFEESDLPFRVDLFAWHEVPEQFQKNIMAEHVVLVERQEKGVPKEWKIIPFTEAVTVNPRVTLKKGTEYPFVDMKTVEPYWRDVSTNEYRPFASGGAKFERFDALLARITPCLENGKTGQYLPEKDKNSPAFGSTEFIVIRGKEGITASNFAYYLAKWQEFQNFAISQMSGSSGRQRVPAESLGKFYAPVPPLPEQLSIAYILGSLDDKIALNRRMSATLEGMAQVLFQSWFVDFDPVIDKALATGNPIPEPLQARAAVREALGNARKPLPADVQGLFPDAFEHTEEIGWVPKGWEVKKVGDVFDVVVGGGTPSTLNGLFWEHGRHLFCTPKDISNLVSSILTSTERKLTDLGVKKVSSGLLPVGTVLLSSRAPIGYLAIANSPVAVSQGIIALHGEKRFSPLYVLCWIKENMDKILERANGSTFLEISKTNFRQIPIVVPKNEVDIFNKLSNEIFARLVSCTKNISELSKCRDTFLPKLLSGELRVADAEKFLEGL